jgi:localization factor PodJL
MSAQSWSVKGIDPKVKEAVREAAARSGMTLGEYLSAALQSQEGRAPTMPRPDPQFTPRQRTSGRLSGHHGYDSGEDEDDWSPGGAPTLARNTDPVRLAQRIDSIERRTQLAVTGLDRAVSTIDRSVLGLSARIDDAERVSSESADRISEALEHFRHAGDTLGGRLEQAETEVGESRRALESAHIELASTKSELTEQLSAAQTDLLNARERLEYQVATAEEVARRAEAATAFLTSELENRDGATRGALAQTLTEARLVAEEAARQAAEASADAVAELRRLQERMADRLSETEDSARRAVEAAIEQNRAEQAQIDARAARAETEARAVRDSLLEEVVRLEGEIGARIAAADQLKADQSNLISRIERAEAASRESTAGLRQAAGAAIADLRNAQLTLAARVKQVEEAAGRNGVIELGDVKAQQNEIADRLAALEELTRANPMGDAITAFEKRLADIDARIAQSAATEKLESVDGAVKTMDQAMQRLAQRIAEAESTANNAIRTLEETVSSLGAKVESSAAQKETDALRNMLEQRLDTMAQSVTQMVGDARADLQTQVSAVLSGAQGDELEGALADVNRRLAAAERRQAQTIEAISIEIKRMSETVDRRLRAVESRNDDAAGNAVREELSRMANTLEHRFDEIERREAAAFDRMGLEVGRLSERLEDRVGAVEGRSAQAIEQVGEQVARMAERFNHRHEALARDLGERMMDSEERAGARVSEAISSMMQRLSEVEEQSADALAPVKKVMTSVASRLEAYESKQDEEIPTPARRFADVDAFDPPAPRQPFISPMEAANPRRAAPLPPTSHSPPPVEIGLDHDIYFAEDVEEPASRAAVQTPPPADDNEVVINDTIVADADAFAPPPEDDNPFWTPDEDTNVPLASAPPAPEPPEIPKSPMSNAFEPSLDDLVLDAPPPPEPAPAGKNDYLTAARKAAQAQVAVKPAKPEKGKAAKIARTKPQGSSSLRGSSRVVLWGSASALTLLIAGSAWYLNAQDEARTTQQRADEPAAAPVEAHTPQTAGPEAIDPNAPFGEPVADPFAPTTEGAPTDGAQPHAEGAPVAAAATTAQPVSARPLPPRNVSLEQAAASGQIVAQYELGLQRLSANRTEEGATLLRQAANRGLAMAQYRLAKLYERGEGVPADLVQARQWTERAAAAGNRRAMHDLGVYFARGEGAPLDEAAAFRWFRQAAELGVADSQFNLGVLYQQGRGVGASASEALFWFMVASRQGDQDAGARAQQLQAQLQPVQVEQARARAEAFRPRAASAQANGEFGPRPWAAPAPRPQS